MATLAGNTIASTYPLLLKIDSSGIDGTLRAVEDGDGTDSALSIATDSVLVKGSGVRLYFHDADGGEHIAGDGTDLTITSGNDIKLAVGAAGSVHSSGVGGTSNTVLGVDAGIGLEAGSNYNVLIGDLVGDASMDNASNNVGIGQAALGALTSGDNNVVIGMQAGIVMTSQSNCVIIGKDAGVALDNDGANGTVAVGANAGAALTSGAANTFIGFEAGNDMTTGSQNIAIGYQTLDQATTNAEWNVAIGNGAMGGSIGTDNVDACVAIGGTALENGLASTASGSVAVGYNTLANNTDGEKNIAIGWRAGESITVGGSNVSLGYQALTDGATGSNNTAIGNQTLYRIQDGCNSNTAVGSLALSGSSNAGTFDHNSAVGYLAGDAITSGNKNTCIGAESDPSSSSATNQTAVGYGTQGQSDNSVTLGDAAVTDVYMAQDKGAKVHCSTVIGAWGNVAGDSGGTAAGLGALGHRIYTDNDANLDNVTLADGTSGQVMYFTVTIVGGSDTIKITPATAYGFTQITFNADGEGCIMVFESGVGWMIVGNNGGAIS